VPKLKPGDRVRFNKSAPFTIPDRLPKTGTVVEAGPWKEQRGVDANGNPRVFNLVRIRFDGRSYQDSGVYNTDYVRKVS